MEIPNKFFKKQLSPQEISFYNLLQGNNNFDFILFPNKVEGNVGYFSALEQGNLLGKDINFWHLTVQAIAKFHHYIKSESISFLEVDKDYYARSLEKTLEYAAICNIELPPAQITELRDLLPLIENDLRLIHDDFLPQNVLVDQNSIKIIDWEDMRFGFAEHDIGRLLSDIDDEDPKWNKKYYPSTWYDYLIDTYLQSRLLLDPTYDVQLGEHLVHLGEMWNYLGPIEMCLQQNDTTSAWFKENLKALSNA